ncbi:sigma-70 family RNA polymerase sigma factor [Nakamurella sp. YIM 132087]|uniref:RNA polymerase sigma factor n=1 Tax=Nakamurella alba TaxID=2665158 RepID=A0A7K1FIU5_9ACTN|nr:RNA polymerase sigma factor [Nakamurella alba]MTD12814.1 sigma-70 family RNA polymerase sigma factor [Nakamurella alba]
MTRPEAPVSLPDRAPTTFDAWVAPHLAVLSAIAVREVGEHDADDLVQETLLRGWQQQDKFDSARGSSRAFLASILYDRARRHRTRRRPDPELEVTHVGPVDPEHLDLERAVGTLPRRQRQVVTLHYMAGLPIAEIAVALSISVGSVKSHLFDARTALRTALEETP